MPGSRNLVVFLGIGLVIVRFWTSGQRTAMSSLWSAGSTTSTSSTEVPHARRREQPRLIRGGPGQEPTRRREAVVECRS
jgi:hypothetical protein